MPLVREHKRERAGENILFNARTRSKVAKQEGDAFVTQRNGMLTVPLPGPRRNRNWWRTRPGRTGPSGYSGVSR